MRDAAIIAFVLLIVSGCLSPVPKTHPACFEPAVAVLAGREAVTEASGRPGAAILRAHGPVTPLLYWVRNEGTSPTLFFLDVGWLPLAAEPDQNRFLPFQLKTPSAALETRIASNETRFGTAGIPDLTSEDGASQTALVEIAVSPLEEREHSCPATATQKVRFQLEQTPSEIEVKAGWGAHVVTAGFWTNGTTFYTNLDAVNNATLIPKGGWYDYEGNRPLKVYVYNSSREERPKRYVDAGFATTIEGFNGALKSMGRSTTALAVLPPELAYTKPQYAGNSTTPRHPLYGDALLFFIHVTRTEVVPCPLPSGAVCEPPQPAPPFYVP